MGQFSVKITAFAGTGCALRERPGEKLHSRCSKFGCIDCMVYDFVQQLKQRGVAFGEATFTHWPGTEREVVDDLVKNERKSGQF